jgi:hypothetical protein
MLASWVYHDTYRSWERIVAYIVLASDGERDIKLQAWLGAVLSP